MEAPSGRGGRGAPKAARATPMARDSPAPNSCLMTEWGEWDECSATCGMGTKKRHRMVKMSPVDGSMCKSETSQTEKCMMPECRESAWEVGTGTVCGTTAPPTTTTKVRRLGRYRGKEGSTVLSGTARSKMSAICV